MSDILESLGIHPIQAPQPLKVADGFEPTKLLNVVNRLRAWLDIPIESGPLMQVREDVRFLLASHLDYFKRYEKWERMYWYRVGSEGNGNVDISWKERAEEMEARLMWLVKRFENTKWADVSVLEPLRPEDTKYLTVEDLIWAIDEQLERESKS